MATENNFKVKKGLDVLGGDINLGSGFSYKIDGTTVIDSSGSFGNISTGSITATGHIMTNNNSRIENGRISMEADGTLDWGAAKDSGTLTWDTGKIIVRGLSGNAIELQTNGSSVAATFDTSQNATFNGNITANTITTLGSFTTSTASSSLGIYAGATQVFEGSTRNLKNLGTISSGAITSTGNITTSGVLQVNVGSASHQRFRITRPSSTTAALYMGVDSNNNAMMASNNSALRIGKDVAGTFYEYLTVESDGNTNVKNELEINGTTVIDTNRALKNITRADFGNFSVTGTSTTSPSYLRYANIAANTEGSHMSHPYFFNDLANFVPRGGSIAISGLSFTPDLTQAFKANAKFASWNANTYSGSTMTITLTSIPSNLSYGGYIGIAFGNTTWAPASCKIEVSTDGGTNWTTRLNDSSKKEFYFTSTGAGSSSINAIRFTLGQPSSSLRLTNIWAYNYQSNGMENYFLSRGGGTVWGDVVLADNVGIGHDSFGFNSSGLPLVVGGGSGNTGMTIFSGNDSFGTINFADAESIYSESYAGYISYNHTSNYMRFGTSAAERVRIDSSGNVGIGTSSPTEKLHVTGGALFTNSVTVGDSASDALITTGVLKVGLSGGTTVIDASRNLTNIGTISSGAITATGNSSIDRITLKASGGSGTSGGRLLDAYYTGDDHLWTLSSDKSSGALTIGYGADSGTSTTETFTSTFDNFSGKRSAVTFRSDSVKFWGTNANVQTTVGSDLTTMTNRITLHTDDGNIDTAGVVTWSGGSSANANTAYGWGDHASAGYRLASESLYYKSTRESNPGLNLNTAVTPGIYRLHGTGAHTGHPAGSGFGFAIILDNSDVHGQLLLDRADDGRLWIRAKTTTSFATSDWNRVWTDADFANNSANWNTAYSWGDHSQAGYLTSETDSQTLSWNGSTGELTISNGNTVDIDGRYVEVAGDTMTGNLTIQGTNPILKLEDTNTSTSSYPTIIFDTNNNQGVKLSHNEFDGELPVDGYGLVLGPSSANSQFPTTGTLSFAVQGEIYAGNTALASTKKVWHAGDFTSTDVSNWDTAYGWGNHASAGYLTGNQTITLTGDVSGSGTTSINVTVANDSHTHDGRYFTESESDGRYAQLSANNTFSGNNTFNGVVYGIYHAVEEDHYYFDDYNGTRNINAFLKTSRSDIIKYQDIGVVEYWNGSSWVDATSTLLSDVEKLLDGRQDTSWFVPSTYYKFRFTVTASTSWPTRANIGMQTSWSGSTYPGCTLTVEELQTDSSWATKVTAEFTSSNGVNNWGTAFRSDSALHTGRGGQTYATRITVDFYGWTPSNASYTTVPLQNIFIYSNYSGTETNDYQNLLEYSRKITAPNGINIAGANLQIGGTSVIDTSRNIINVNNITAGASLNLPSSSSSLGIYAGTTQVFEGSTRNLKNIGTISSGSITSSGAVSGVSLQAINTGGYGSMEVGGSSGGFIDLKKPNTDDYDVRIVVDAATGGRIQSNGVFDIDAAGDITLDADGGDIHLKDNGSSMASFTTGAATFAGTISSGAITTSGAVTLNNNQKIYLKNASGTSNSFLYRAGGNATRFEYADNAFIFDAADDTDFEIRQSGDAVVFKVDVQSTVANTSVYTTGNFNAAQNIQTNGTTRITSTGNLTNIGSITAAGNITTTETLQGDIIRLTNDSSNTARHRISVYDSGTTSYGMMLWNSNGTGGDWSTMIYGPNQANRRISFGKITGSTFAAHADVTESMFLDLDNDYLFIKQRVSHYDDDDTYVQFDNNRVRLVAGGTTKFDSNNTYQTTTAPSAVSITSTSVVSETIEIVFSQSSSSNVSHYEIWSDGGGTDFSLIGKINNQDAASSMSFVDTTFTDTGTINYRIYVVSYGVYSTAATTSASFSAPTLDVTNFSAIADLNNFYLQYEKPDTRFLDHIEIYVDTDASSANLARANATLIYSGDNSSYVYTVSASDRDNFHQFWVECVGV